MSSTVKSLIARLHGTHHQTKNNNHHNGRKSPKLPRMFPNKRRRSVENMTSTAVAPPLFERQYNGCGSRRRLGVRDMKRAASVCNLQAGDDIVEHTTIIRRVYSTSQTSLNTLVPDEAFVEDIQARLGRLQVARNTNSVSSSEWSDDENNNNESSTKRQSIEQSIEARMTVSARISPHLACKMQYESPILARSIPVDEMQRRLGVVDERYSPPSPPRLSERRRPSTLSAWRRRTSTLLARSTSSASSNTSKRSSIATDMYVMSAVMPYAERSLADDSSLSSPPTTVQHLQRPLSNDATSSPTTTTRTPPPTLPKSFALPLSALVFDAIKTKVEDDDDDKSPMGDSGHASRSPSLTNSSSITMSDDAPLPPSPIVVDDEDDVLAPLPVRHQPTATPFGSSLPTRRARPSAPISLANMSRVKHGTVPRSVMAAVVGAVGVARPVGTVRPRHAPPPPHWSQPWFHGFIDRAECERRLLGRVVCHCHVYDLRATFTQNGSYIVREKSTPPDLPYVLSVIYDDKVYHTNIRKTDTAMFVLGKTDKPPGENFTSIVRLVTYYKTHALHLLNRFDQSVIACVCMLTTHVHGERVVERL